MDQANVDLSILQETNITNGIYTRFPADLRVVATDVPSCHGEDFALFYNDSRNSTVEGLHTHGPNVLSFQLVSGGIQWHFVGWYLAPHDASTL